MKIQYPTINPKNYSPPYSRLIVCDQCEKAHWSRPVKGMLAYCIFCNKQMREATRKEYLEAEIHLKQQPDDSDNIFCYKVREYYFSSRR